MLGFTTRTETGPPPTRSTAVAAAFLAVGFVAVAVLLGRSSTEPSGASSEAASGTVAIDGRLYPFTPQTCVITDQGFVASGRGLAGDEPFVASVSKMGGVQVAFGVRSDVDEPDPDELWWVAGELRQSRVEGNTFRATARVEDRSGTVPGSRTAVIKVTCPEGP